MGRVCRCDLDGYLDLGFLGRGGWWMVDGGGVVVLYVVD